MVDVYSIKCYTVTEKLLLGGDTLIKEFNDLTNFTSDKYLQINSCGFQSHGSSRITVLRSNGRKDYHFLYVINGECTAHTASGEKRLSEGDLLLYRPHEKQMYSFDSVCRTYWIHFTGYGVEELLNASNFDENIIHVGTDKTLIRIFDKIINDFVPNSDNIMSISWFMQFCVMCGRFSSDNDSRIYDERILSVTKYMNKNYAENKSVEFYAKMCGLSPTRFAHLFKASVGVSPHKYIKNLRIRHIEYLLTYSDMNVSEAARATGFDDALYMSRLFRKSTGLSPKEYIEKHRV